MKNISQIINIAIISAIILLWVEVHYLKKHDSAHGEMFDLCLEIDKIFSNELFPNNELDGPLNLVPIMVHTND